MNDTISGEKGEVRKNFEILFLGQNIKFLENKFKNFN